VTFRRRIPRRSRAGGLVIQFGHPPNRIDLVNDIDGVSFNEAWPGRMDAVISTERGEVVLSSGARLW